MVTYSITTAIVDTAEMWTLDRKYFNKEYLIVREHRKKQIRNGVLWFIAAVIFIVVYKMKYS